MVGIQGGTVDDLLPKAVVQPLKSPSPRLVVVEEAFDAGLPITECIGIANKTLYAGLHFSRHDTISSVLWNEFSAEVSLEAVRETAIRLRPLLEEVFAKYPISDEFAYMPEYNSLYTEITGFVQLKLEEDGKL